MCTASLHTSLRISILVMLVFGLLGPPVTGNALTNQPTYPQISNYFLRAGTDITEDMIPLLARYDLLILPAEAQVWNHSLFAALRTKNPDIVILAYVPTTSYALVWDDPLHARLRAGIKEDWWLKDHAGNQVSIWPRTQSLNLATGWAPYLATFAAEQIYQTGLWDGIFFDEVGRCFVCTSGRAVDLNQDGTRDTASDADPAWLRGTTTLLETFRDMVGAEAVVITNGSSAPEYQPFTNGRMFESFPTPWEGNGAWETVMQSYNKLTGLVGAAPPVFVLDGDTGNTGVQNDYRDVRFGLTSTLLEGGYFGYSWGTQNHGQLWWYDEYDAFLGKPESTPIDLIDTDDTTFSPSIWRRDFEHGIVIVNATETPQTISLGADYEKLHGTQDPRINDGSITSRVRIGPEDGLVLLRLTQRIQGVSFPNGGFTRILRADARAIRTGFFVYDPRFGGGAEVINADLDGDGNLETIGSEEGRITIWKIGVDQPVTFAPYGEAYTRPIPIAVGDTNGNGYLEIVTGTSRGGGPHVRFFSAGGRALSPGFFAFDPRFRGGIALAMADLDGNGTDEIIVGKGSGSTPTVRTFAANGTVIQEGFHAYHPGFRGGVHVAAGDVDGDGAAEIITGAGYGGGPHVRIFTAKGKAKGRGFFPYDAGRRTGVMVGASDLTGDGIAEIFALTTDIL